MSSATQRQRLDGKVAIITGATGGIGEATAKLFLELGAKTMLVGRSRDKLDATRGRLEAYGDVRGSLSDATNEAGMAAAVAATLDQFGGLDILIANAGTEGVAKPLEALAVEEFEEVMRTNVTGVWLAMKHCVAPLKARGGGSIVALSSIAGCIGFPGLALAGAVVATAPWWIPVPRRMLGAHAAVHEPAAVDVDGLPGDVAARR